MSTPLKPSSAQPEPKPSQYRPLNARRRLLIGLLAVVTAITVVLTLLHPPGGVKRVRKLPADVARCAASAVPAEANDCVGGRVDVIVPVQAVPASGG
ncbi:MAG: hypothetical protein ACK5QH_11345 [Rubrivivax sp.]|jgi:hypothetical protein